MRGADHRRLQRDGMVNDDATSRRWQTAYQTGTPARLMPTAMVIAMAGNFALAAPIR